MPLDLTKVDRDPLADRREDDPSRRLADLPDDVQSVLLGQWFDELCLSLGRKAEVAERLGLADRLSELTSFTEDDLREAAVQLARVFVYVPTEDGGWQAFGA